MNFEVLSFVRKWTFFLPFWPPLDTWGSLRRVKSWSIWKMNAIMKFLVWNNVPTHILRFSKLIVGRSVIFYHFEPRLTPGVPQKGSRLTVCQTRMPTLNSLYEIKFLCESWAFVNYSKRERHFFTILIPLWPLRFQFQDEDFIFKLRAPA